MGLATLEVMQAMYRTWSNSKVRVNGKTRQMQWRDMFDIAVKWRRWGEEKKRLQICARQLWTCRSCRRQDVTLEVPASAASG